jgi:glycolate oxidase iron-sulfur subunit
LTVAFRPVHRATLKLLAEAGFRATTPAPGGCCGALAAHYGQPEAAQRMARERIVEFESADLIVVNSAGCSAHMKTYGELLADDPVWAVRAERVAGLVRDLLEVELRPVCRTLGRVTVHDACHHLHAQRIGPQLRDLLSAGGAECVEVADAGRCCGAAGLYSVTEPELSAELRLAKASAIDEAGAPIVAVANPGCAAQIAAGLREIGSTVEVIHPAELLAT